MRGIDSGRPLPLVATAGSNSLFDSPRSGKRILVLPDSNAEPPGFGKPSIGIAIACTVPFHLLGPEVPIRRGDSVVLRAPMPKAAVQEDRYLST